MVFRTLATLSFDSMKKEEIKVSYSIFQNPEELPEKDLVLLQRAEKALTGSYSPYSDFRVGAAVLLANGEIVEGANQENAAYPSGLCAERVALFYASAKYENIPVVALAITARSTRFEVTRPVPPCGSCCQVMAETESRFGEQIRVILRGESGPAFVVEGINNLLPFMFHPEMLKK